VLGGIGYSAVGSSAGEDNNGSRKNLYKRGIKIVPTYHPAALLRDPNKKKPCWNDFKVIRTIYDSLKERKVAVG